MVGWQQMQPPREQALDDPEPGDEELVAAARHDRAAFALLYRRYATPIYRYCDRALGDRAAAEEVTQTVFLRALAALPAFRDGGSFRSWLFAIAHNAIADAHRARRPLVSLDGTMHLVDSAAPPEELALAAVERREIRALLARLPAEERELVELRLAGLRDKEIAEVLGRTPGAVRTAQYRAVKRLRVLLHERVPEPRRAGEVRHAGR